MAAGLLQAACLGASRREPQCWPHKTQPATQHKGRPANMQRPAAHHLCTWCRLCLGGGRAHTVSTPTMRSCLASPGQQPAVRGSPRGCRALRWEPATVTHGMSMTSIVVERDQQCCRACLQSTVLTVAEHGLTFAHDVGHKARGILTPGHHTGEACKAVYGGAHTASMLWGGGGGHSSCVHGLACCRYSAMGA